MTFRCFKVSCQAVGVHPPLELSHYQIKFSATSLYDTSVSTLYVINSHLSMNKMIHSLPQIGSEEATPVGPTSFEFLLPPNSPITISPSVGTVLPGKVSMGPTDRPGGGAFWPSSQSSWLGQELIPAVFPEMCPMDTCCRWGRAPCSLAHFFL